MGIKRRVGVALAAVFAVLASFFVISVGSTASAATCSVTLHWVWNSNSAYGTTQGNFTVDKYRCSDGTTYAKLTGVPSTECIHQQVGFDTTGVTCYNIPGGYTPPKTSITTPRRSISGVEGEINLCLNRRAGDGSISYGGCKNEDLGNGTWSVVPK